MKSKRPKALHEVCGKPMLHYILEACYDAGVTRVLLVVGHGKDEVIAAFGHDRRVHFVEQTEQLGTGHAARMAAPLFVNDSSADVFVLAGDGPLIREATLTRLLQVHRENGAAATLATAILDDPSGYGRVVRHADGSFRQIVEQKDATPAQLAVREVNPSYYCFRSDLLFAALAEVKNTNSQREYYLTDVPALLQAQGHRVSVVDAVPAEDVLSINTPEQLAEVDRILRGRLAASSPSASAQGVNA
jgi:bifunctional UDP-N-acetylglucosamine pyrophosphorylase/glucosamine-1-phosphate N-acetyltransferase